MPDWSYQTLLGPAFRALPPRGRPALRRALDRFGRSPLAGPLVGFFGHMAPDASQRTPWRGEAGGPGPALASPVGLGSRFVGEGDLLALPSRFGVGFAEVGPVGIRPGVAVDGRPILPAADVLARLSRPRASACPVALRLAPRAGQAAAEAAQDAAAVLAALAPRAAFVTLRPAAPPDWTREECQRFLAEVGRAAQGARLPVLLVASPPAEPVAVAAGQAREAGLAGLWLEGGGPEAIRAARRAWPSGMLAAQGGLLEPGDAVEALDAGADLVALDEGLHRSGPGLPKRIHEALRHRRQPVGPREWGLRTRTLLEPWTGMAWMALVLMGAALVAWGLGATRVLLGYDERFLGMGRAELHAVNGHLVDFLAHDRISFAATTLSMSIVFLAVAVGPYARGEHWARRTLVASGIVGFASFFLFLGFGYLDPLHVVVWLAALAGFLWGIRRVAPRPPWVPVPDLRNDARWRRAQWGQALLLGLAFGLVTAGVTVSAIACLGVFVATDLEFMGTDRETLDSSNDRLLSVVAHDRAGFGGALAANGLGVFLVTLWGFRRGARWLWWTLLASGVLGFAGVLWIHARVGYLAPTHMAPAYLALAVFVLASALTRGYLADRGEPMPR